MTDQERWWTAAETIMWICTRNLDRVSTLKRGERSSFDDVVFDLADDDQIGWPLFIHECDPYHDRKADEEVGVGEPGCIVEGIDLFQLIDRCKDGKVRACGRQPASTTTDTIHPADFTELVFQIMPDGLRLRSKRQLAWENVHFNRDDCEREWRPSKQPDRTGTEPPSFLDETTSSNAETPTEPTSGSDAAKPDTPDEHETTQDEPGTDRPPRNVGDSTWRSLNCWRSGTGTMRSRSIRSSPVLRYALPSA